MLTVDELPKILHVNDQTYYIRGAVVFTSGNRAGLRVTSGHYKAYSFRSNDRWEVYDDLKENVQQCKNIKTISSYFYTQSKNKSTHTHILHI